MLHLLLCCYNHQPFSPPPLPSQNSSRLSERGTVFLLPGVHVLFSLPAVEMVGEVRSTHSELHLSSENGHNVKGYMMTSFNKWHQRAKHSRLGGGSATTLKLLTGEHVERHLRWRLQGLCHIAFGCYWAISLGEQYFRVCQCHCYVLALQVFFLCAVMHWEDYKI